jgi:hypothetical protein
MKRALLRLVPLISCLALVACGGGGSDSGGAIQPPQTASITVTPAATTLGVGSITDVQVRLVRNGAPTGNGQTVTLSVAPSNLGQVGAAAGANQSFGNTATAVVSGGVANFRFKSTQATGTATLNASASDPNTPNTTISGSSTIQLNGGPSNDTRLTLEVSRTTLPTNPNFIAPFIGSPYEVEVAITWRNLRGELVVPAEDDVEFGAAWQSPNQGTGAIGRNDDPETDDVNEYLLFFQSVGVPVNSGRGTVYVRSTPQSGTGRLTVSAVDPDTGENLSAVLDFSFSSGAPALPGAVGVAQTGAAAYVVGSGGPTSRQLQIFVNDGAGSPVPNPQTGGTAFNNVRLEILNAEGERLSAVGANGANQTGTVVNTRTFNGVAGAVFLSGNRQGSFTVRATADRADNNVDNGITDPVVGEGTVIVSDGRLFSVTLTSPALESLFVNRPDITVPGDDVPLPPPNGTYSLTVGAIATDRLGNPALPGTELQFGLIDSPVTGFPNQGGGNFAMFGLNGDPQEGGTLFTAAGGGFTTAGGGAGPGDTLVLFGRDVAGNRDLEGARVVGSVNSADSLTVTRRFNLNDDTGASVNNGPVIPYAVGRATIGNIGASATTNEIGVATTTLNYPVSQLGRNAIVWVQGNGPVVAGEPKTVGDVEFFRYAGVGPGVLTVAPNSITANTGAQVVVCLTDARNEPIQGVDIGFAFEGLTTGSGEADGQSGSGAVGPTDTNGCVAVAVSTGGIEAGDGEPQLRFFAGGAEAVVEIVGGIEPTPPGPPVTLTINIIGSGTGNVLVSGSETGFSPPNPGGTVLCAYASAPCTITFVTGAIVGLSAQPTGGSNFVIWSGDCLGTNVNTVVTMTAARTCTATFN